MKIPNGDVNFVLRRLPKDVIKMLKDENGLMLAGGFIRATIAGEKPSDIDILGPDKMTLDNRALNISLQRPASRVHRTSNAITIITPGRLSIQFITRWTYTDMQVLIDSFDFTIAQAVIKFDPYGDGAPSDVKNGGKGIWRGLCSDRFYRDLAAKRLVYTSPTRDEDAGGSMMRVRKFLSIGYNIQAESLGKVIGRVISRVDFNKIHDSDFFLDKVIIRLLREVDPLVVTDGVEPIDEHELIVEEEGNEHGIDGPGGPQGTPEVL